jgi:quinol monooxygenase YgiN
MVTYQFRVVVAENKFDEFIESLFSLSSGIRKEQGCLDFSMYRDLEKKDVYSVIGEWKTRQAMEKHFKHKLFPVLIGAAKVLSKDFEFNINETLEKGSYQLAKNKITLHPKKGEAKGASVI